MTSPDPSTLTFDEKGLIVAVAQDTATGTVLMVAYMDREALSRTAETGEAHFWSRRRQRLWRKGETSGNVLHVEAIQAETSRARQVRTRPSCSREGARRSSEK
jgi:phosphoribosyl-AMP cyclohydrolase